MPLNPNALERLALYRVDLAPAPMLDLFGAGAFEAVTLAMDLGILEALAEEPATPADLAARLDADPEGMAALLGWLAAQGYLASDGGTYRPSSMTRAWLLEESDTDFGPFLTFWNEIAFPYWREHLTSAVVDGPPERTLYEWLGEDADRWEVLQRGFKAAASVVVDEFGTRVDVPDGATSLLDVGGGHGLYAARLCERHPDLAATVFDHPDALDVARETAAEAGVGDRVETIGGDYWTDDLGDGYNLALLCNVIHAHDPEENARLFGRVADALAPGGRIVVLDQFEGSSRFSSVGWAGLAFVTLTYHVTLGASIYPYEDVGDWLRGAGFTDVRRQGIRRATPGNAIVQATKGGE